MVVSTVNSTYDRVQPTSTQRPTARERTESAAEQTRESASASESTPAQPVVNTQGQTTGRLLNVSA